MEWTKALCLFGLSLNSILIKGHETLFYQCDALMRWRTYEKAPCSDVTKAYYSLKTGELEKHVLEYAEDMEIQTRNGEYLDLI